MLAADDICRICGHGGARTADHIISARLWPRGPDGKHLPGLNDPENLQPAHGTMGSGAHRVHNRCPVCRRLCNQSAGAKSKAGRISTRKWL